jgi:GrpB-like predicted nucleotidyltransferase (UPF0157 family)
MMRVAIVQYDSRWPLAFAAASKEIAVALGENLLEIHHIGSTSIPNLCAKPVIDMLAVVADIETVDRHNSQMAALGYEAKGEFGIPGRRFFRRDDPPGVRTHQVHAFQNGSPDVDRHLAFRDFLRGHREIALQYGELKQKLAALHPNDIEAYMDGKDAFIKEIEVKALVWAAQMWSGGINF